MEQIDIAFENFQQFTRKLTPSFFNTVKSEADARLKLIDPIFIQILGWSDEKIFLEESNDVGRIDYRFVHNGLSKMIVEAKKDERDLGINPEYAARFFKLDGAVFKTEASQEGISQVIRYCSEEGAELGCVTNGRQWYIFRGNRIGDGMPTRKGLACAFGSLEAIQKHFKTFYELLSLEYVSQNRFRGIFQQAEGQPHRSSGFRETVRRPNSKQHLQSDELSQDLDRIMLSFFQELGNEDDAEARRACFVTTSESTAAEKNLARISEELRDRVQSISTSDPSKISEVVSRAKDMQRHEMILLVGTKGAGKSTFVDRFFGDVIDPNLREDCVVVRVDLAECGCDVDSIGSWLDRHLLSSAEKAAFSDRPNEVPDYRDLQGMFHGEYLRLSRGSAKHLYESDKRQFKIDFGKHVEQIRTDQPNDYIISLLNRIGHGFKKVPCVVFDNADHFDVPFQEAVFKYSNAIYQQTICLMILPITDTTSWQLSKHGAMQSFFTDSYYLPTPDTSLVLKRRIEFIEKKVQREPKEKGTGYFFGKGIKLEVENIKAFAACLQSLFIDTGKTAEWIGQLSNGDIRRSLQITRELVASPHIKVVDILKAFTTSTALSVEENSVRTALICGKYDIYPSGVHSFVQNMFDLIHEFDTTPLAGVRLLQYFKAAFDRNPDNDHRYVGVDQTVRFFNDIGIPAEATIAVINALAKTGLVLAYDPRVVNIDAEHRVQISPSGMVHLNWAIKNWVYLESMAYVTPIYDTEVFKKISLGNENKRADYLRDLICGFIKFLVEEDSNYVNLPAHELYSIQRNIHSLYQNQIELLERHASVSSPGRYSRLNGRIKNWNRDKGFGFVQPREAGADVFLHISDVIGDERDFLPEGTVVEYDIARNAETGKASAVNARAMSGPQLS